MSHSLLSSVVCLYHILYCDLLLFLCLVFEVSSAFSGSQVGLKLRILVIGFPDSLMSLIVEENTVPNSWTRLLDQSSNRPYLSLQICYYSGCAVSAMPRIWVE